MFRKLVFSFILLCFTGFLVRAAPFNQNFFNSSFSPVVIPNPVSNNSVNFYLDFFNPLNSNTSFIVYIGGDDHVFSKSFNFSKNFTLKPYEHFRLNTTVSPEGELNSGDYFLVVEGSNGFNSNFTVLEYLLFENNAPSNFFDTYYTSFVGSSVYSLNISVDFFNPYENTSNFSIIVSNADGSDMFQEQSFNLSLNHLQHAKFSFDLSRNQNPSLTQNPRVWLKVYDLTHQTLVVRQFLEFSGFALPQSKQKSVFEVVQQSFSLWFLVLITILACFFLVFSLWDYFSNLKNLRRACGWLKEKIKAMVFFIWRARKSLFKDFWSVEVEYKTMKVLIVLTVVLLLLQSLNIIQVFSLWVLLVILLVLGFLLAVEEKFS